MVTAAKPGPSMTFRITPGARLRKADAQVLGTTFEKIKRQGQPLTAETVLAEAMDPKSPIRRFFEWDDKKAAHSYRLEQARKLVRSIEVVIEDAKGKVVAMKGYYSVEDSKGERAYQPMAFVFNDTDMSNQVVEAAYTQLQGWVDRYKKYQWARGAVPKVLAALRVIKKAKPKKAKGKK